VGLFLVTALSVYHVVPAIFIFTQLEKHQMVVAFHSVESGTFGVLVVPSTEVVSDLN
jgi:hypothetical protein